MVSLFKPGASAAAASAAAATAAAEAEERAAQEQRRRDLDRLSIASMEAQLLAVYAEKELLHRELGVSAGPALVRLVRSLEKKVKEGQRLAAGVATEVATVAAVAAAEKMAAEGIVLSGEVGGDEGGGDGAPGAVTAAGDEVLDKIEEFSDRVRLLSGTVTSMEAQLLDLYAEKDLLHQEVGVTRAADIVARLREAAETRAELAVASERLERLEAGERDLRAALGCADGVGAAEVAAAVRSAAERVRAAHADLERLIAE